VTVHVEGPAAAFTPVPPTTIDPAPAVAVMVGDPPQLLTTFGVAAITMPVGKVSVKVRPLAAPTDAGLVMVKVKVEGDPTPMVVGLKAFVNVGRPFTTNEAPGAVPLMVKPLVAVRADTGSEYVAGVALVTLTFI
jgi:hypothetical protein